MPIWGLNPETRGRTKVSRQAGLALETFPQEHTYPGAPHLVTSMSLHPIPDIRVP